MLHDNGLVRFNQARIRRVSGNFFRVVKIVETKMPGATRRNQRAPAYFLPALVPDNFFDATNMAAPKPAKYEPVAIGLLQGNCDLRSLLRIVKDVPQTGCGHEQLE